MRLFLLVYLIIGIPMGVVAEIGPQIGQGAKSSRGFGEKIDVIEFIIENKSSIWSEGDLKLFSIFRAKCQDSDSVDTVTWETFAQDSELRGMSQVNFTCFEGFDPKSGSVFTFNVDVGSQSFVSASMYEIESQPQEKNSEQKLKIVLVETLALSASAVVTIGLTNLAFPGESDKRQHAVASSLLASVITAVTYHFGEFTLPQSALIGMVGSCVVGAIVEVIEPHITYNGVRGDKDFRDFKADAIGCVVGSLGMAIAIHLMEKLNSKL